MAIRRGTAEIRKIYRGSVEIKQVYRGTAKVWSSGPPPFNPADHYLGTLYNGPIFWAPYANSLTESFGSQPVTPQGSTGTIELLTEDQKQHARYRGRATFSSHQWLGTGWPGGSMGAWVRVPTGPAGGREIMHWRTSNGANEFYISCDRATGRPYAGAKLNNVFQETGPTAATDIRGTWTHLYVTLERNASGRLVLRMYINGALADGYVQGGAVPTTTVPAAPLYIGGNSAGTVWDVEIDDPFVMSTRLVPSQLQALVAEGRS